MRITEFQGKHRFLSNFVASPVMYDGMLFPCVENAYQAAKTTKLAARLPFCTLKPGEAKRRGRKLTVRPDWEEIKVSVMANLIDQKFNEPEMAFRLLKTDPERLEEGNNWGDTFWGVDIRTGLGQNQLGKILMAKRKRLVELFKEAIVNQTSPLSIVR